ncbi:MAG: membrane protein of unknown function [Promethearchaeota archaeon]|nr:MAG: membrane protein of unknown function [Candidatus Lokiarchaeota archaeon]
MYCTNCGKKIEETQAYCTYCGENLQKSISAPNNPENLFIPESRTPRLPSNHYQQQNTQNHNIVNLNNSIKYSYICFSLGLIGLILPLTANFLMFSISYYSSQKYIAIPLIGLGIVSTIFSMIYKKKSEKIEPITTERKIGSIFAIIAIIANAYALFSAIISI